MVFALGTTWLQEITYLVCNDADTAKATQSHLYERFPFVEATMSQTGMDGKDVTQLDYVLSLPSPRLIKTHLPLHFFEASLRKCGAKVLVPIRNPKDYLVSLSHFYLLLPGFGPFQGTWDEFFQELFCQETTDLWRLLRFLRSLVAL